jgi:hypothetical protein
MKTITRSDKLTEPNRVAYETDAPISSEAARYFHQLYAQKIEGECATVEIRNSVIYATTMMPPAWFPDFVLGLLNQAEALVQRDIEFEREKVQAKKQEKQEFIDSLKKNNR